MKGGTEKRVSIFIAVLVVAQGLYAVFPLPDIRPLADYSMFRGVRPVFLVSGFWVVMGIPFPRRLAAFVFRVSWGGRVFRRGFRPAKP